MAALLRFVLFSILFFYQWRFEMSPNVHPTQDQFPYLLSVPVRWNDYDMVTHVNNVQFYVYFQEAVVSLLDVLGLDWLNDPVIAYVVESKCQFLAPIPFPSKIVAGIGVERLGRSSMTYTLGLYAEGKPEPVALGHFVHVFVDRGTERSASIPERIRAGAERYLMRTES